MVSRFLGAGLGLLAFAVVGIAGLLVRNPVEVTLSRALLALVVFFAIGRLLGGAVELMVDEHVRMRKKGRDQPTHAAEADQAATGSDAPASAKGSGASAP